MGCKFCNSKEEETSSLKFGNYLFLLCSDHRDMLLKAAREKLPLKIDFR